MEDEGDIQSEVQSVRQTSGISDIENTLSAKAKDLWSDNLGPGWEFSIDNGGETTTIRYYPEMMELHLSTRVLSLTIHNVVKPDTVPQAVVFGSFDRKCDIELTIHRDGTFELQVQRPPVPPKSSR